jgi:hypothetical protein
MKAKRQPSRRRPAPAPAPARPTLTLADGERLAVDLVLELAEHAGDPAAVGKVLTHWLDAQDVPRLGFIAMAGIRLVFADRLQPVPVAEVLPGDVQLIPPDPDERPAA